MAKSLSEYLLEMLNEGDKLEKKVEKVEEKADDAGKETNKADESIKDEKTFRDYAKNKFEEVFGDDLDEKKMNETIDGLLKDNKDLVDKGEWGELVGMLNKSFSA